ncbi:MAG: thioredoxin domain-containing protein [bacterium]|nr:thioredoxin domain-containing protein [bacterium]
MPTQLNLTIGKKPGNCSGFVDLSYPMKMKSILNKALIITAILILLNYGESMSKTPEQIRKNGNHLVAEPSLYLKQHAHNPVDWYPWSDEALDRAKAEDKPIFLSIGYSSCHWCHVMEHEVFEHDDVAEILNRYFICIKVDREERPDIDAIYMEALVSMQNSGGWPMSMFLTPDLKPFYGATYIPHDQFINLSEQIVKVFHSRRSDLESDASGIIKRLSNVASVKKGAPVTDQDISAVVTEALRSYDNQWGGFRSINKFPTPLRWQFLLHYFRQTGDTRLEKPIRHTLDVMNSGGIHDHLGGGFHRYATDEKWIVPHFEIMLYDNTQLAMLYLESAAVFNEPAYEKVAIGILDFLISDMQSSEGGFYASFDADSGDEEGSFQVWTLDELIKIAGTVDGYKLAAVLGVNGKGNFEGKSVLTRRVPDYYRLFEKYKQQMLEARRLRTPPELDEKIVTAWNGLAVSALARSYAKTGDQKYLDAAVKSADFLWNEHQINDGTFCRTSTDGVKSGVGILDDYSFLACGFIDLYEATGDIKYLEKTGKLLSKADHLFADDTVGYFLAVDQPELPFARRVEVTDSVEPSGFASMLQAKIRYSALTGAAADVEEIFKNYSETMQNNGMEMAWWFDAAMRLNSQHDGN